MRDSSARRARVWWPIDGQYRDCIATQRNANACVSGVVAQTNIAGPGSNPGSGTKKKPGRTQVPSAIGGQSVANPAETVHGAA